MSNEDFILQLGPKKPDGFVLQVERSPAGAATTTFRLPEELTPTPYRDLHAAGGVRWVDIWNQPESSFKELGKKLYESLFQNEAGFLLQRSLGQTKRLRIQIRINPKDSDLSDLLHIPWEILCEPNTEKFFSLSRELSLTRLVEVPYGTPSVAFSAPLRILVVTANPKNCQDLDIRREADLLKDLEKRRPEIVVELLEQATLKTLRAALRRGEHQILHYIGHGSFDGSTGTGWLAFHRADGTEDVVHGRALATKLQGFGALRLVFLNACNSGMASNGGVFKPFAGVANALIRSGIPSVLAMQQPIRDRAAIAFSEEFYGALVEGKSLDEAVSEGRHAIHSERPESIDWAIPCLFARSAGGQLFEGSMFSRETPPLKDEEPQEKERPADVSVPSIDFLSSVEKESPKQAVPKRHGLGRGHLYVLGLLASILSILLVVVLGSKIPNPLPLPVYHEVAVFELQFSGNDGLPIKDKEVKITYEGAGTGEEFTFLDRTDVNGQYPFPILKRNVSTDLRVEAEGWEQQRVRLDESQGDLRQPVEINLSSR